MGEKVIIDVDKALRALREVCRAHKTDPDLPDDQFFYGFMTGALAMIKKDWKDLCRECEGCPNPVCMPEKVTK